MKLDFAKPIHVHFIGIGGISMSGLAEILLSRGFTVSGSDMKASPLTEHLAALGATIMIGQRASNITDDIDLVVYTAAISKDNMEFEEVVVRKIPMMTRAELLGQLMTNYETPICVSGTHGKTTTTSMISEILMAADADPTLSIGGILKSVGGNLRIGSSGTFVTEACEYTNSYHSFFPKISLILNIEEDHMDFFKDLADIRNSFHTFAKLLPSDGTLIINHAIENLSEITGDLSSAVITFGNDAAADYHPEDITFDEMGRGTFTLVRLGKAPINVKLSVIGMHNVLNACAAFALADLLNIPEGKTLQGLANFTGTERRFEKKGTIGGVHIYDDYAHHPTEIAATLSAASKIEKKRLIVAFQPHTYTRTKAFLDDFAKALSAADMVILADIYAAREKNTIGISSRDLLKKLEELGTEAYYFPTFDEIEAFILENCSTGDMLITMGAGDIVNVGENLLGL
ncbi:MAG: UDP-N-acetylmuramate--L-alanine ligase [Lachnospiraceae bacterium]|nr:UDP-N-acetylmuramate--L-alanine ligase [Lachnospiraceae bacterium]